MFNFNLTKLLIVGFMMLVCVQATLGCKDENSALKCYTKRLLGWCNGLIFGHYMKVYCRKTCKLCSPPPPPTSSPKCRDLNSMCDYWLKNGQCNAPLVRYNCPRSCLNCVFPTAPTNPKSTQQRTTPITTTTKEKTPVTTPIPITTSKPLTKKPEYQECGLPSNMATKVMNGVISKPNQWPWHAALYLENKFHCSGVLVKSRWVITSAHCLKRTKNFYKVVLGDSDLSQVSFNEQVFRVDNIFIHEQFDGINNDVAIIKLDRTSIMSNNVKPICLKSTSTKMQVGRKCVTTGYRSASNISNDTLKYIGSKVIDENRCKQANLKNFPVSQKQVCTMGDTTSACFGELGSPLTCQERNGRWYLQGTKTWLPTSCRGQTSYDISTRISEYISYIETTIAKNDVH